MHADLLDAKSEGRLFGILNGCEYTDYPKSRIEGWPELVSEMQQQQLAWMGASPLSHSAHIIAQHRLNALTATRPDFLLTSVGRITHQKIGLMLQPVGTGQPALEAILDRLGDSGVFIMLGSGEPESENALTRIAGRYANFIYLQGYSEAIGDALYALGDLFFMPSAFEPCGISQMLAMRAGQPCLVHHIGGLRDTVADGKTGFTFTGDQPTHRAENLLAAFQRALNLKQNNPSAWSALRKSAKAQRFLWADTVKAYLEHLYRYTETIN